MAKTTIDNGFEVYSPYRSKCSQCKHFNVVELKCKAFETIPDNFLSGDKVHDKIIEGQIGDYVFTPVS